MGRALARDCLQAYNPACLQADGLPMPSNLWTRDRFRNQQEVWTDPCFSQELQLKKKKQSLPVKGEGHCVQIKYRKKICTDDILIFYFDFHSFLQSDAGVETNLLMMFKVFIVFWKKKRNVFLLLPSVGNGCFHLLERDVLTS